MATAIALLRARIGDANVTAGDRNVFNLSTRKVGGVRFIRLGRLTITLCVSQGFKPIKGA